MRSVIVVVVFELVQYGCGVVSVSDEESEGAVGVVEVHEQVASQLSEPCSGGVGGDAEDVHAAGGVLDDEERVEPMQSDRIEMK